MCDTLVMQILDGFSDVFYFFSSFLFRKSLALLHLSEKGAFLHVLEDKVNIFSIVEATVDLENVLVIAEALNLDLQHKLVDHIVILDHLFGDFLQGEQPSSSFMYCLENCSKLAFP